MIIGFIYINVIFRILAPTTYIFFASAIPVISFGEQLERNTGINMNSARNFLFSSVEYSFSKKVDVSLLKSCTFFFHLRQLFIKPF